MIRLRLFPIVMAIFCGCSGPIAEMQHARDAGDVGALELMLYSREDWVVEDAARALGDLRATGARESLEEVASDLDRSSFSRTAAILALGQLGQPESIQPLLRLLENAQSARERQALVQALGVWCEPEVLVELSDLVDDPDLLVSRPARQILARCGGAR